MRRQSWIVFAILFSTYAYFYQGGGWNQNARFNQVRSIVEQGSLSIEDYVRYAPSGRGDGLRRLPLPPGIELSQVGRVGNTGDVARPPGSARLYPNKPPGTTLFALPVYFALYNFERAAGFDPDAWEVVTLNAYLCSVFSVALFGAMGGVLLLRTSRRVAPRARPWTHTAAALTFGLGTLMLPYSTMFFDHVLEAVLLLFGFACLLDVGEQPEPARMRRALAAGAALGLAACVNYRAMPVALLLVVHALVRGTGARTLLWTGVGALPGLGLLLGYHALCFGTPFALANTHQSAGFSDAGLWLGAFHAPKPEIAWDLLVGWRRGLLVTSPVMLLAFAGVVLQIRDSRRRPEGWLFAAVFAFYWTFNASFFHWHGGYATGPRYLIPALPFLCLALGPSLTRWPRTGLGLAGISACIMLAITAIDGQAPLVDHPWRDYLGPLFTEGVLTVGELTLEGPVSVNPIGSYEGWYYRVFPRGSREALWNSFNLGELVWPQRRLSVVPILLSIAFGVAWLFRDALRSEEPR